MKEKSDDDLVYTKDLKFMNRAVKMMIETKVTFKFLISKHFGGKFNFEFLINFIMFNLMLSITSRNFKQQKSYGVPPCHGKSASLKCLKIL